MNIADYRYDSKIIIETPHTLRTAMGGISNSWTPISITWAAVFYLKGRELEVLRTEFAEAHYKFVVRFHNSISSLGTHNRILDSNSKIYNILSVKKIPVARPMFCEIITTSEEH